MLNGIVIRTTKAEKMENQIKEEISLLQQASHEIKSLRNQNELQRARLNMFDDMMALLHTEPASKNKGMMSSPDLVFKIDELVESKRLST